MSDQAMSMVERVARAMARANYPKFSESDINGMWEGWSLEAISAIEGMREPDEGMIEAGEAVDGTITARDIWSAMIDAALRGVG